MKDKENYTEVTKSFAEVLGTMACQMMEDIKRRQALRAMLLPKHTQLGGMATYDDGAVISFLPDDPVAHRVPPFRGNGTGQVMSDGTFYFVRKPQLKPQSKLIRKLAHGRVSETKDGAVQLTIKVYEDEGVNISQTIAEEAEAACRAIVDWQMKR